MQTACITSNRCRSWEDGGGITDDGTPNTIPEPRLFQPIATSTPPGPKKTEILERRHRIKASLWCSSDATTQIDYVRSLTLLGYEIREAALAERGIRWGADGVKLVPGESKGDPPRWRAQIWDPSANDGKGGHIHLGYANERGDAVDLITAWYKRYCGLDMRVEPPKWFKELLADAIVVQAGQSDSAGGMAWDVDS